MANSPDKIVFRSTQADNSSGYLICFITFLLGLMFVFARPHRPDPSANNAFYFLGGLELLGVVLILYQKRVIVSENGPAIDIRKGFWPFLKSESTSFAFAQSLIVTTFATRGGRGYIAVLAYSDDRRLRLIRTRDAKDLTDVARLSRLTKLPIVVKGSLLDTSNDPAWGALGLDPPASRF